MRPKLILGGLVTTVLAGGLALAQGAPAGLQPSAPAGIQQDAPAGLQTGPATIAPHWTKNTSFPTQVPEGTAYYIVVRGDTLWDIAARYLKSPYLWPQIWDQNKYVTDAHWIYPGDPILLPKMAMVAEQAGQAPVEGGPEGLGEPAEGAGAPSERPGPAAARRRRSGRSPKRWPCSAPSTSSRTRRTRASTFSAPSWAATRSPWPSGTSSTSARAATPA